MAEGKQDSVTHGRMEAYAHAPQRILFLESIAAVPGMVAAALRHLRSVRLMVCVRR